ncbi:MAG TPA: hypothetical protein P5121_34655 [Caldilineaceae bacterium]|nr:hypothetical protein [Caldilineaceae bacterium]
MVSARWLVADSSPWQARVPARQRYFSTNHLMGDGYWVWLIPLATGYTSVGVVTQESIHPFATYKTYERALRWLHTHEPRLAAHIAAQTPLDFRCMQRMQCLFIEWDAKSPGRLTYDFMDYLGLDFLCEWRLRNLQSGKSTAKLIAAQQVNMKRFEELAQVLFLLAVEDVLPDYLECFSEPLWLNTWRVGLDPERWEKDGLFKPTSAPRDLSTMRAQIRNRFYTKEPVFA